MSDEPTFASLAFELEATKEALDAIAGFAERNAKRALVAYQSKTVDAYPGLTVPFSEMHHEKRSASLHEANKTLSVVRDQLSVLQRKLASTRPKCDVCGAPAEHAENFHDRVRYWCEEDTPWSGHFEFHDQECAELLKKGTVGTG